MKCILCSRTVDLAHSKMCVKCTGGLFPGATTGQAGKFNAEIRKMTGMRNEATAKKAGVQKKKTKKVVAKKVGVQKKKAKAMPEKAGGQMKKKKKAVTKK